MMQRWSALFVLVLWVALAYATVSPPHEPRNYLIVPVYHSSHWRPQVIIAKELVARGNNVTFLIAKEFYGNEMPEKEFSFANVELFSAGWGPEVMQKLCRDVNDVKVYDIIGMLNFGLEFNAVLQSGWESEFKIVMQKYQNNEFDTLISDFSPGTITLCSNSNNITCFVSNPFVIRNPDSEFLVLGARQLPYWFPLASMGYGIPTTFVERLLTQIGRAGLLAIAKLMFRPFAPAQEYGMTKHNLQPIMLNSFRGFDWNVALPPHVRYIGPLGLEDVELAHEKIMKKHQDYLQAISSGSSAEQADEIVGNDALFSWIERNPVIAVVSFGKSVELSANQFQILVDFAAQFEGAVLWSVRKHQLEYLPKDLPNNLRIETWIAYSEVISHPNIKLVISQCGVATAHEAVIAEVPMLCIPILFDQYDLAGLIAHHQVGDVIWKEGWASSEPLLRVTKSIIEREQQLRANARKLHLLAKYTKPSIGEVVDWMETIELLGKKYFLPPIDTQEVRFYEYNELTYLTYLLIAVTTFILVKWGCICCCCCCCLRRRKAPKQKTE